MGKRTSKGASRPATRPPGLLERWIVPLAAVAGVVALTLLAIRRPDVPPPPAPAPPLDHPRDMVLPLDGVDRITALGGASACILGGRRIACTEDAGETWTPLSELPEHALAVARVQGETLVAAADGAVYAVFADGPASLRALAPPELSIVDAVTRHGEMFLLAHRYDDPRDPLRLPRVSQTVLLFLEPEGRLAERGRVSGYAGERLLAQGDEIATFAPYDPRAFRSTDGGRTFRRVPARERLAASFGGLLATVERRSEKMPGGGARPVSTLVVSGDGAATWSVGFEAPGELVVDFLDARRGVVIARDDAAAFVTADGARTFRLAVQDERLADAVDVAGVGAGWIAVTAGGHGIRIAP